MARPTAAPAITPSDSGVSMTRFAPCLAKRPSVARNTPPLRPTSSPNTTTRLSRAISSVRAWFTASTTVSSAMAILGEAFELPLQARGSAGVDLAEIEVRVGRAFLLRLVPRDTELLFDLFLDPLQGRLVHHPARGEMQLHPAQRVAVHPQVVQLARLVATRVVGGRVKPEAVRDRFDQCRALTFAGAARRLTHRGVHGEQVVAVALDAGEPVRHGFLSQRLGCGLLRDAGRDRPAVVLAEEDDRRFHDPGQVRGFVEVTLRRPAVAEDRKHDARVVLELESPREADRLRKLAGDRGLKGKHLEVARHLEGDRMPDMPEEGQAKWVAVPQLAGQLSVLGHEPVRLSVDRHGG